MAKKKKDSNAPKTNDKQSKLDPRLEDAIFSKKDSLITITTNDVDGGLTASNFHLVYDAIEDRYNFYSDGLDKDQFFTLMYKFLHYCGIITIRTFLDEISHQHYTPEGRSVAIPFKEIRIFLSENGVIHSITPEEVFLSMVIDYQTQKPNWSNVDKSEIYCDEERSVPMETLKQQLAPIIEEECRG